MISDFNQLEKLFIEIDQQLTNDVPLYVLEKSPKQLKPKIECIGYS